MNKINENELTEKVLNRLAKNNLVRTYKVHGGRGFQTVTHYEYDDGLELQSYSVIKVLFNDQEIGHLHRENRSKIYDMMRKIEGSKKLEAFKAM